MELCAMCLLNQLKAVSPSHWCVSLENAHSVDETLVAASLRAVTTHIINSTTTTIQLTHISPAGYRVAKRRRSPGKIGPQHCLVKEDAIKWFQTKYEGVILPGKKK